MTGDTTVQGMSSCTFFLPRSVVQSFALVLIYGQCPLGFNISTPLGSSLAFYLLVFDCEKDKSDP
jgi:hypothetical protein